MTFKFTYYFPPYFQKLNHVISVFFKIYSPYLKTICRVLKVLNMKVLLIGSTNKTKVKSFCVYNN